MNNMVTVKGTSIDRPSNAHLFDWVACEKVCYER